MKRETIASIGLLCLLSATACKTKPPAKDNCEDVICTMMFAMISVTVEDNAGNAVALDSFYTMRGSNGEKIRIDNGTGTNSYVILDDSYVKKLANKSDQFSFIGYKNGKQIVNQAYTLSADCCHVKRDAGPEKIALP